MNNKSTPETNRLYWSCRRGMLELDLILIPFCEQHYPSLTPEEQTAFKQLLTQPDPVLLSWLMTHETPTDPALIDIVTTIRRYATSTN